MKSVAAQWFCNAAEDCANAVDEKVTHFITAKTGVPVVDGIVRTSFSYAETVYAAVMVGSLHTLAKLASKASTFHGGFTRLTFRSFSTGDSAGN